jgi:hypothetical protein
MAAGRPISDRRDTGVTGNDIDQPPIADIITSVPRELKKTAGEYPSLRVHRYFTEAGSGVDSPRTLQSRGPRRSLHISRCCSHRDLGRMQTIIDRKQLVWFERIVAALRCPPHRKLWGDAVRPDTSIFS